MYVVTGLHFVGTIEDSAWGDRWPRNMVLIPERKNLFCWLVLLLMGSRCHIDGWLRFCFSCMEIIPQLLPTGFPELNLSTIVSTTTPVTSENDDSWGPFLPLESDSLWVEFRPRNFKQFSWGFLKFEYHFLSVLGLVLLWLLPLHLYLPNFHLP